MTNKFLLRNKENSLLNQYWYSTKTIDTIILEVEDHISKRSSKNLPWRIAFVSTPSIYFSIAEAQRSQCNVFDIDEKWKKDSGFVSYNFNEPTNISDDMKNKFTMVIIDPPFITKEVWQKYTETAHFLLCNPDNEADDSSKSNCIIASTIAENQQMMEEFLNVHPVKFKPSIPNLVYQYNLYCNYQSEVLSQINPEVDF
ncbi:N(6)-adenine-specific DNA methyltransferase [Acrasis kona]|uniref:N(6)-adenine-specific DNA methyltransferase n=1 Tax=Acrasis kona TaxID=1008807 RepID=A0AAW2YTH2_9EUKA